MSGHPGHPDLGRLLLLREAGEFGCRFRAVAFVLIMDGSRESGMEHDPGTETRKHPFGIEDTISLAFRTAHLLTASVHQAESAVLKAIGSFDPESDSEQTLLRSTMHAAVCSVERKLQSTPNQPASTGSSVPIELQAVLHLSKDLRRCFVLRILVGMSRQACARLLRLKVRSVDQYTRAALQCLAGFDP